MVNVVHGELVREVRFLSLALVSFPLPLTPSFSLYATVSLCSSPSLSLTLPKHVMSSIYHSLDDMLCKNPLYSTRFMALHSLTATKAAKILHSRVHPTTISLVKGFNQSTQFYVCCFFYRAEHSFDVNLIMLI